MSSPMADQPIEINPDLAAKALEEGIMVYPKFAAMKPYLERVPLFKGSMILVKFGDDRRVKGDPENFMFEKLVVKAYRALAGEG